MVGGVKGDLNSGSTIAHADSAIALRLAAHDKWHTEADASGGDGQVTALDTLMIALAAAGNIEVEGCESK